MSKPGFNILAGPDSVLLREHIDSLLLAHAPEAGKNQVKTWERHFFWGDEPLTPFWEKLTLQGLFAEPRVVVLRNAQNLPAAELKKISAALGSVNQQIWPFICFEVEMEKGKAKLPAAAAKLQCLDFARKQGWYSEIPGLDPRSIKSFAAREAKRLELYLSPQDLESVSQYLPPDAGAIRLEMEKLALACPQNTLTPEALAMLEQREDMDIFSFLQGLQNSANPAGVWGKFMKDNLASSDSGLFSFLAMLLREARILWQLKAGENVFLPPRVIQDKTRLAGTLGYGGLARIWDLALQADKGVKTGERSPQQAFERIIAELFTLFRAQSVARPSAQPRSRPATRPMPPVTAPPPDPSTVRAR
ncbi:MAG: DNA polymerase III subunit delta [Deltaproteobacteria bacterium]|jgi:DNA polymerase-3 subunit delta|nr:DNA polymerase III subunit delta [Deltaproteobacteria bacterium]